MRYFSGACLTAMVIVLWQGQAPWAATGEILGLDVSCQDQKIILSGRYIMTEDETPRESVPDSPFCSYVNEKYPAHYVPFVVLPMSNLTHAFLHYTLDGSDPQIISRVLSSYLIGWSHIGAVRYFAKKISLASLPAGSHIFTVTLQDWFGVSCYSIYTRSYGYLGGHWGDGDGNPKYRYFDFRSERNKLQSRRAYEPGKSS